MRPQCILALKVWDFDIFAAEFPQQRKRASLVWIAPYEAPSHVNNYNYAYSGKLLLFVLYLHQVLSAGTYSNRPDGTIACDPALRPVIINSAGTTFSSLGYDGTTPYAADLLCEYQFQAAASDVSSHFKRQSAIMQDV